LNPPAIQRFEILESKLDILTYLLEGKFQRGFLTVIETAELLRCDQSSIRDKMRNGLIPFSRLGTSTKATILIKRADLRELLK